MSGKPVEDYLPQALAAFDFGAPVEGVEPYGAGHVNHTFCVHTGLRAGPHRRYILQRISPFAFKRHDQVMDNVIRVTRYLGEMVRADGGDPSREALTVIPTTSGATFYPDEAGGGWRVYPFVEDTLCLQAAETPAQFAAAGRAFGRFQWLLRDYPAHTLHETIPRFHDTEDCLDKLKAAAAADPQGRLESCRKELRFALDRGLDCSVALEAQRQGVLPTRVTHNDTKLNNVLLDKTTGEGVCVIDLDTVMPGLAINDFGDAIRYGANHCAEDEKDLTKVALDLELYAAYAQGFLEGAHGALTPAEVAYMPWGARLMTLECGIRFLTDYLEGDPYFHTTYPGHNLDRCRTQFKLVSDMESHWDEMNAIIAQCVEG